MHEEQQETKQVPWAIIVVIIAAVIGIMVWQIMEKPPEPAPVIEAPKPVISEPKVEEKLPEPAPLPVEDIVIVEPEPVAEVPPKPELPALDNSDVFLADKLPTITWRKELLKLVINEDLIRRFVVFTDNFSQGNLSYEHSPFIQPVQGFYAQEVAESDDAWRWDETSTRRFSLYVDLLRSLDSGELVTLYYEIKPLIDQAYQELGYPEQDFTDVLQVAITRVLDTEMPQQALELSRPSVMYKFQDEHYESLDDADKLLLRIGKENVLVVKSILLEINDKISRANQ